MNEYLLDQLPILSDFRRMIEELAITEVPSANECNLLCIEMISDIREPLLKQNFKHIACIQQQQIFSKYNQSLRKQELTQLADMYNLENIEQFLDDPKCTQCGQPAQKRCSQCKLEWYCSRQCQLKNWKNHKTLCNIISNANANTSHKSQQPQQQISSQNVNDNKHTNNHSNQPSKIQIVQNPKIIPID